MCYVLASPFLCLNVQGFLFHNVDIHKTVGRNYSLYSFISWSACDALYQRDEHNKRFAVSEPSVEWTDCSFTALEETVCISLLNSVLSFPTDRTGHFLNKYNTSLQHKSSRMWFRLRFCIFTHRFCPCLVWNMYAQKKGDIWLLT